MKNKGFSLIELIIVVAIMAVLVAIIAPNLTKYLGRSKEQTDKKNLDEVKYQVQHSISDAVTRINAVEVVDTNTANTATYVLEYDSSTKTTKATNKAGTGATTGFATVLEETLGDVGTTSSVDKGKNKIQIDITVSSSGGYNISVDYVS